MHDERSATPYTVTAACAWPPTAARRDARDCGSLLAAHQRGVKRTNALKQHRLERRKVGDGASSLVRRWPSKRLAAGTAARRIYARHARHKQNAWFAKDGYHATTQLSRAAVAKRQLDAAGQRSASGSLGLRRRALGELGKLAGGWAGLLAGGARRSSPLAGPCTGKRAGASGASRAASK